MTDDTKPTEKRKDKAVYEADGTTPKRAFLTLADAEAQADAIGGEVYQEGVAFGVRDKA
jgi:hypothetical protein